MVPTPKLLALALVLGLPTVGACGGSPDSADSARPPQASATPPLDPQNVPADLRHLVPLAQEWGIGDDVERAAKVDAATSAQRDELRQALEPHQTRITQWLDSFGQGLMSQEAASFMYTQLALEEMVSAHP